MASGAKVAAKLGAPRPSGPYLATPTCSKSGRGAWRADRRSANGTFDELPMSQIARISASAVGWTALDVCDCRDT